jgi:DNA-binding transcriptional regulator WhiA
MILNDSKAKYFKKGKSFIDVLIDNCPIKDYEFNEICEAYDITEDVAMEQMTKLPKDQGEFVRLPDGFEFNLAD